MTDQLTPEGIARCRELLTMYAKTELGVEAEVAIRPEIERFLFDHADELFDAFESNVRQSAVVSDLIGNVTHLDRLLGLTEVPEECPEYAPDGYAAELERVVSALVAHNEDQPGATVHEVVAGLVADHGGAPAQGPDGDHWHLSWQFKSDVWSELSPSHKLQLRVVTVNRAAAGDFVAELRDWIAFIERSVLEEPSP